MGIQSFRNKYNLGKYKYQIGRFSAPALCNPPLSRGASPRVARVLTLRRMKEITKAVLVCLGTMKNVRGVSAEPSGACCGGGKDGEQDVDVDVEGRGGAVVATMRDDEMADEEMEPTGRPPAGGDLDDDLDDEEEQEAARQAEQARIAAEQEQAEVTRQIALIQEREGTRSPSLQRLP